MHAWHIGTSTTCPLQLAGRGIALRHAELVDDGEQWRIRDLESATGLRQDGQPRKEFVLTPGVEVGIGSITLIAESKRSIALREFCARMLGWSGHRMQAVDHALRAIRLAAARRSTLILQGEEDLVPLAYALHRRVLGGDAPFVVCDRHREDLPASVRSPANHSSAVAALAAAAGGSLCLRNSRLPRDLSEVLKYLYEPDCCVQLIVCIKGQVRGGLLPGSMPIEVPPLGVRETELPRIVQAYADDALAELLAPPWCFTEDDHGWVMAHSGSSLSEIEKATLRIVALRMTGSVGRASKLLGMAPVSLSRWLSRRAPLTTAEGISDTRSR